MNRSRSLFETSRETPHYIRGARVDDFLNEYLEPVRNTGARSSRSRSPTARAWALQHPACGGPGQDDFFAEQMALFYNRWATDPHPLGDLPLIVVDGTQRRRPPPGLSESEWRSDSLRIDLSKLSRRGRLVTDSLSGHHVQLDNPGLVVRMIREVLRAVP